MQNSGRLEGRTALVTGGSRGIGAAIVRAFASEGCDIAFNYLRDENSALEVVAQVRECGRVGFAAACDVADAAAVASFVDAARRALGHIDIVVNNAGISGETAFEDITLAAFDRMIAVHLRGTFLITQLCYPEMRKRGFGRIINVTSQLAYKGAPGLVHYCAAKAGLIGFTRALAHEAAAFGVLVNAIAPGPVDTDLMAFLSEEWKAAKRRQLPLGRFGRPEEIAPTAVLLASDDGAFFVGQTLSPNGGDVML
jgi:3-oxoacyl-[acyl-carrier protein] reductase